MSEMTLKYDSTMTGAKLVAVNADTQFQTLPGNNGYGAAYDGEQGDYIVCTGYYYIVGTGYSYVQGTDGWYAVVDGAYPQNWKLVQNAATVPYHSESQAQALVNQIIRNNESILRNNLLCARFADRFTAQQQQQIVALQKRLQARNEMLQAGDLCDKIETGHPAEYAELSARLERLMSGGAVGIATWVVVVIAATVIAGLGTAAYFTYKSLAEESEKDVKFSKELTASLVSKLTEDEYQQLLQETKGLLTKSKVKSLVRGYSGAAKVILAAVGVVAAYRLIQKLQQ